MWDLFKMSRHLETAKWDDRRFRIERRVLSVRYVCRSQKCFFKKVMFMHFKGGNSVFHAKLKTYTEKVTPGCLVHSYPSCFRMKCRRGGRDCREVTGLKNVATLHRILLG